MKWLNFTWREIESSKALKWYGAALCCVHVLTFYFWRNHFFKDAFFSLSKDIDNHICWSFAPYCKSLNFSVEFTSAAGTVYALLSLYAALCFIQSRVARGWSLLLLITLLKYFALLIDYRLMGNYHYMGFIITFCYLFLPKRSSVCQLMIIGFYVASGCLKFNNEWLSAAALGKGSGGILLEWMCAYVVVLEVCLVFGLLSNRIWLRWLTLAQLIIFHLYSFTIVGFFFPAIMFLLLSLFPLCWWFDRHKPFEFHRSHVIVIALFAIAQLIPHLQAGDPALVGKGRLYSINLFDSNPECFAQFFIRYKHEMIEVKDSGKGLVKRLRCDPLIFWNKARTICKQNEGRREFDDLDFILSAKRFSDPEFQQISAVENFCKKAFSYSTLFENDWQTGP